MKLLAVLLLTLSACSSEKHIYSAAEPFSVNFKGVDSTLIAEVDGFEFTREQVLENNPAYQSIEQQIKDATAKDGKQTVHDLQLVTFKKNRINAILQKVKTLYSSKKLHTLAKSKSMGTEDFIQSEIIKEDISASKADAREFAKNNNIDKAGLDKKMIKRLQAIVVEKRRRKHIDQYLAQIKGITIDLYQDQESALKLKTDNQIAITSSSAPIQVNVFTNIFCKSCKRLNLTLKELSQKYYFDADIVIRPSFAKSDAKARLLYEAAYCVKEQSEDAFFQFWQLASAAEFKAHDSDIFPAVEKTGIIVENFRSCFLGRHHEIALIKDRSYAESLGINHFPTTIIPDVVLTSEKDMANMSELIARKIKENPEFGLFRMVRVAYTRLKNIF